MEQSHILDVRVSMLDTINLAMQQNGVTVVRELTLKNPTGHTIDNISLQITADPDFAATVSRQVGTLAPSQEIRITDIEVKVNTGFILSLTEPVSGYLQVTVNNPAETLYSDMHSITILPYDHWEGVDVLPQYTAAFVTPNHPEVARVLRRACEILGKWTGNPCMDEYQQRDPARVRMQVAAIYEALRERHITYCTAPASFLEKGQRVRLCAEIFSAGIANCLDLSLLMAACLEGAGLHSLLVFVEGHAFCGAWLVQDSFSDTVNDDTTLLSKRVAQGICEIVLVEATGVCAGMNIAFDAAVALADDRLRSPENFLMVVDVARARFSRIRPLPQRIDGTCHLETDLTLSEADDGQSVAPASIDAMDLVVNLEGDELTKQKLWERKLLDLSLRNNLLNTRISRNTLQLITVNVGEIEDAIADGEEFSILEKPSDWENPNTSHGMYLPVKSSDPVTELLKQEKARKRLHSYLDKDQLRQSLTYLYRSSRISLEENGANTLYLAIGLLRWLETPTSTRPRFAPILLLPIEIVRRSAAGGYVIRGRDEDTMLNITLMEMLRQFFGINIGGLDPLPKDDSGVDVPRILNTIRKAVMGQQGWDVEEQAIIGTFYFSKFIMWNDIHNHASLLARNPIVASLMSGKIEWSVGDQTDPTSEQPTGADDVEDGLMLPISADSSQMQAIRAAISGTSFILHGPPGTGKSQTITNIIANALYQGKKVLFVAEKMAALQVVQRRLESIGLAPFCLELHSNKAKKTSVLSQLKETTEVVKRKSSEEYALEARETSQIRAQINDVMSALHRERSGGYSLYDCFCGYAAYPDLPVLRLFDDSFSETVTREAIHTLEAVVAAYEAAARVIGSPDSHPLRGIERPRYSAADKNATAGLFERLSGLGAQLPNQVAAIQSLLELYEEALTKTRLMALHRIVEVVGDYPDLPAGLYTCIDSQSVNRQIREAAGIGLDAARQREQILGGYRPSVLDIDTDTLQRQWIEAGGKWWLARIFAQNKISKQMAAHTKDLRPVDKSLIPALLDSVAHYQATLQALAQAISPVAQYLPAMPSVVDADWQKIADWAEAAATLDAAMLDYCADPAGYDDARSALARAVGNPVFYRYNGGKLRDFRLYFDELTQSEVAVSAQYGAVIGDPSSPQYTESYAETTLRWRDNLGMMKDWTLYIDARRKLQEQGLGGLSEAVETGTVNVDSISDTFRKSLYRTLADHAVESESMLSMFHGALFDEKIARFKQLCKQFERLTRDEIFARLASRLPALQKEAAQSSDVGILQRAIRSNGRGISIRQLFDQIGTLITRMCPCMLMSPISVAQYINATGTGDDSPFDLVVFDEASQMPTCEAVGAIARGRNVIVVGDPRQMPPTSFFLANRFDEENADKEDLESILDDCLALSVPSRHLLWHYRSRHESLIAFSNVRYYDNKLLTFPSPDDLATKVTYKYVQGVYDRGRTRQNRAEAEAVVAEIERRLSDSRLSRRSIGVVTFNTNQQSLIEDILNDLYQRRPDLERLALDSEEPIFIKNLENVQGDERDVILFSVGYGPDSTGKVALNFGPLNRDGGWRRLNVAVSRARYEMVVYSTLRASDIDLSRTNADGVAGLRAFLEYAEKGTAVLAAAPGAVKPHDDALAGSVAGALTRAGHQVKLNVGCSGYRIDIGVVDRRDSSRYILGIVLDGYNFQSGLTVRDREITQPGVLASLGWNLYRLWSLEWWDNPEKAVAGVLKAIDEAYSSNDPDDAGQAQKPFNNAVSGECGTAVGEVTLAEVWEPAEDQNTRLTQYTPAELAPMPLSADDFLLPVNATQIKRRIKTVLEKEAPITKGALIKKIIASHGIARAGARIAPFFDIVLAQLKVKSTTDGSQTVLWHESQDPDTYDSYRVYQRDALDIPVQEVMSAMRQIFIEQVALTRDDLMRVTAHALGYARLGDNLQALFQRAVENLLSRGEIVEDGTRLRYSDS